MKDLRKYKKLQKNQESSSQINTSQIYMSGISKQNAFDYKGDIIDGVSLLTPNFSSYLVEDMKELDGRMFLHWKGDVFDYMGLAVVEDEILWIDTTKGQWKRINEDTIEVSATKRGFNGTIPHTHTEKAVIRSVINITEGVLYYNFNNKCSINSNSLFGCVVSSGSLSMYDDIRRWAHYYETSVFDIKQKTPIYIFNGCKRETICVNVGFLSSFDMDFNNQQIDLMFENKFSLYWDEKIKINKTYENEDIRTILSEVLFIPKELICFPKIYTKDGEIEAYNDLDFFKVPVLSTKNFKTYKDFLQSLCKELLIRITFDENERLIVQSEVKKTLDENTVEVATAIDEYNDLTDMTTRLSDDIIINSIESDFKIKEALYGENFKYKTKTVLNTIDQVPINECEICIVKEDIKHENKDTWYKKEVVNYGNDCKMEFKFRGYITTFFERTGFPKQIKYSYDKKIENFSLIQKNENENIYFNGITVEIGEEAKYLGAQETYVMLTDGKRDFTGMVASVVKNSNNKYDVEIIFGFDRDSNIYDLGFYSTLEKEGYLTAKNFYLYYVRLDMVYIIEYANSENKTYNVETPILQGQNMSITTNFGGVSIGDKKFANAITWIDNAYENLFTNKELFYNREYAQDVPVYIKTNKIDSSKPYFSYSTFDNSDMAVFISKNVDNKQEYSTFSEIKNVNQVSENDFDAVINICNLMFNFDIEAKYTFTLPNGKAVPKGTILTALNWEEVELNKRILTKYKIEFEEEIFFVDRDFFSLVLESETPLETIGFSIRVSDVSKYKLGDIFKLHPDNEKDENNKFNYLRYNEAFWIIKDIDYDENILFFDYEMITGENNSQMKLELYNSEKVLMLQEFAMRGNPYLETTTKIKEENIPSINKFGKMNYSDFTGEFLSKEDLQIAGNYLINSFDSMSVDSIKKIFPVEMGVRNDLCVLDCIEITERIYSGMIKQKAIITKKSVKCQNGVLSNEFELMTIGKYTIDTNILINTIDSYNPNTLPEYSHNSSATEEESNDKVDLKNVNISKFDKYLGSVSLLRVATGNLVANLKEVLKGDDKQLVLYNIKPNIQEKIDGEDDKEKRKANEKRRYYTDALLSVGKELFIEIANEFFYVKVSEIETIEDTFEDSILNLVSATVNICQRKVFNTSQRNIIHKDSEVKLYQITSMSNESGLYTLNTTVGDIENREYFSFNIEDGIRTESHRGKMLIACEKNLEEVLREKYKIPETVKDIYDYLGKGFFQIGDSTKDNGFMRYAPKIGLRLAGDMKITSEDITVNTYKDNNFMRLTKARGLLGIGTNGSTKITDSTITYFQIGEVDTANSIVFGDGKMELNSENTKLNKVDSNSFIHLTNEKSQIVLNQLNKSTEILFQIGKKTSSIWSDDNKEKYVFYDGMNLELKMDKARIGNNQNYFAIEENKGLLYLNGGSQQIGSGVKDSTLSNYNGFYFGKVINGSGALSYGKYIKYDGSQFSLGDQIVMYNGDNPIINFENIVSESVDQLNNGTTIFNNNVLKIYSKHDLKYKQCIYRGNPVSITTTQGKQYIEEDELGFGVSEIPEFKKGNNLLLKVGEEEYEYIIKDVLEGKIILSKTIPYTGTFNVYIINTNNEILKMGDLSNCPDTGEYIRIGSAIDYTDKDSYGIKIVDDTKGDHFLFTTTKGFQIQSNNRVDLRNGYNEENYSNRLLFDKDKSFISMCNGFVQAGRLHILPSELSSHLNAKGGFIGDSKNGESYLFYTESTGIKAKGDFEITGGKTLISITENTKKTENNKKDIETTNKNLDDFKEEVKETLPKIKSVYLSEIDPSTEMWYNQDSVGKMWVNPNDNYSAKVWTLLENATYGWRDLNTYETLENKQIFFLEKMTEGRINPQEIYPKIKISQNDVLIVKLEDVLVDGVIKATNVECGKTFVYTGQEKAEPKLTNPNDFLLVGTATDKYIKIETDNSSIYFDNRFNNVDKIEIAKDGSKGLFSIGKVDSDNFMEFDTDGKIRLSTSGEMILKNGIFKLNSGDVKLTSGSNILLESNSNMFLSSSQISISSGSSLILNSNSNISINSGSLDISSGSRVSIISDDFNLISRNMNFEISGIINISNDRNLIYLNDSNSSFVGLNLNDLSSIDTESTTFALGDEFKYYKNGQLDIIGSLSIKSLKSRQITKINEEGIANQTLELDDAGKPRSYIHIKNGDIFFKKGKYETRANIKMACSMVAKNNETINLRDYSNGEPWEKTEFIVFLRKIVDGTVGVSASRLFDDVYKIIATSETPEVNLDGCIFGWYAFENIAGEPTEEIILQTNEDFTYDSSFEFNMIELPENFDESKITRIYATNGRILENYSIFNIGNKKYLKVKVFNMTKTGQEAKDDFGYYEGTEFPKVLPNYTIEEKTENLGTKKYKAVNLEVLDKKLFESLNSGEFNFSGKYNGYNYEAKYCRINEINDTSNRVYRYFNFGEPSSYGASLDISTGINISAINSRRTPIPASFYDSYHRENVDKEIEIWQDHGQATKIQNKKTGNWTTKYYKEFYSHQKICGNKYMADKYLEDECSNINIDGYFNIKGKKYYTKFYIDAEIWTVEPGYFSSYERFGSKIWVRKEFYVANNENRPWNSFTIDFLPVKARLKYSGKFIAPKYSTQIIINYKKE